MTVPFVVTEKDGRDFQYDIFSLLLKERIVFISGPIDDMNANIVVGELLYLASMDSFKEISIYINSPGGSVSAGMAIYDTIRYIKAPVHTIGVGFVASTASILLASGDRRSVLPHTKVMIHQPILNGGMDCKETDITILAKELSSNRRTIAEILARHTNKSVKRIEKDIENDKYMNAEEALEYGISDNIIEIK